MRVAQARSSGTRLLAAVVLSACVGVVAGGLGAWGVYTHFGPAQRVVTETRTGGGTVSVGDVATSVLPSVVTVSTTALSAIGLAQAPTGLAEGFVASAEGLVVTTAAAVHGASRLRVATADGHGYDATIAATDVSTGIVVLRAAGASGLVPLHFAGQDPRVGDLGIVVFRPALGGAASRSGVVAAVGITVTDGQQDLQDATALDSSAAPGAEGAPLVDATGAVLGVVTTVPSVPGVTAASGVDAAALVTGVQQGSTRPTATFGVTAVVVDAATAAATGVSPGALVRSVAATGPATGLLAVGDVVTSVNGASVTVAAGLDAAAFGLVAGDTASLQVVSPSGMARTVRITLVGG